MEATQIILFLVITLLFSPWFAKINSKWAIKQKNLPIKKSDVIRLGIVSIVVTAFIYYFLVTEQSCSILYAISSLIISAGAIFLTYRLVNRYRELSILHRISYVIAPVSLVTLLNAGIIFFCQWIFPDVTTVKEDFYDFTSQTEHSCPFVDGFKPTGSYFKNETNDTFYRVVVSYALIEEETMEEYNHYNVTDTFPPATTVKIACPPNYVAKYIIPIRLPGTNQFGKYRTRRSYIITKEQLDSFTMGNFTLLGIKGNILEKRLDLKRNPIIWEDPKQLDSWERTVYNVQHGYWKIYKRRK